jgi:hypothetical protein
MSNEAHPCAVLRGHEGDVQALTFDQSETHLISGCAIIGISRSCYTITCTLYPAYIDHAIHAVLSCSDAHGEVRIWDLEDLRPRSIRR